MEKLAHQKKYKQFYELAKDIKNSQATQPKIISYSEVYNIVEQNELYQIMIDLQNTELQKAILRFEEERTRHMELYDFIPFGCFTLDQQGIILSVNEAGADLIGVKKVNLLNKNLLRYIAANFQHACIDHFQRAITQPGLQSCEIKLLRKNAPLFYTQFDTKAIINSITKQLYLLVFIKDVNQRKQQETNLHEQQKKLTDSEKTASMGEFAEIISHELSHPLAVITNYIHGCIRRLESGSFQQENIIEALKKASEQSHRINEIILRMKNFTFKGTMNYELVNINHLIQETIDLIRHENSSYPIQINFNVTKTIPLVTLDKIHIEQVIVNLARNAIEAMKDNNKIEPKIFLEVAQINIKEIEISVINNGPPIPPENLHKLFNPYFTTKPYGVGLGLAVSKKIIEAHGGVLIAEKHLLGTCFRFTLPITPPN